MDAILAAYNSGSEGSDGENGSGYGDDGTDAQAKRQKTIGPLPSPALSSYNYFAPPIVEIPGAVTPQRTVTQGACISSSVEPSLKYTFVLVIIPSRRLRDCCAEARFLLLAFVEIFRRIHIGPRSISMF